MGKGRWWRGGSDRGWMYACRGVGWCVQNGGVMSFGGGELGVSFGS